MQNNIGIPTGVKKIGQKYFGKCAICKQIKELSLEHIPPRCAFNKGRLKIATIDNLLKEDEPWINEKTKNTILKQGGFGYYSLCRDCNTQTGLLYVNAYKDLIYGLRMLLLENKINTNETISIAIEKIKPLNVIKQIISMFNTVNPKVFQKHGVDISQLLLDKNNKDFCSNIYFYIYLTESSWRIPLQGKAILGGDLELVSEIAHYPLGIIMSVGQPLADETCCINNFLNYEYDEEVSFTLNICFRERNLPFARDYRTKEEIKNIADTGE